MVQTLVVITSIVVLAAAILTSTLVSAKNALHQVVIAKTQTAMTDATSDFTSFVQGRVSAYGTEENWVGLNNQGFLVAKPMCATAVNCGFYETTTWSITGATIGKQPKQSGSVIQSTVQNMAEAVDEQRLSATVSVIVSNASGDNVFGSRTEQLTVRLFDATPFAVVTAVHDTSSEAGSAMASEGDSGGAGDYLRNGVPLPAPTSNAPANYTKTIITATIDCTNSAGFDEAHPKAAVDRSNGAVLPMRQGGSLSWSYQLPCTPTNVPTAPPTTKNYSPPVGTVYQIGASDANSQWQKNNGGQSFPR